jgi:hypothetical protein
MQQQLSIIPFPDQIPEIREHIIYNLFPYSFNKGEKPKIVRDHITSMSLVNKRLNKLVHTKEITQAIIDRISECRNQNFFAKNIGTPSMINYLKKSKILHKYIHQLGNRAINHLIEKGADINYFPQRKCPLLFKTLYHYNKTKYLLDKGVNPNIIHRGKTAIQLMIEKNYFFMTRLLLSYNPQNKCLPVAVFYQNNRIIKSILKEKNIPLNELNESLGVALQRSDNNIIKMLINAGAESETVLAQMEQKMNAIKNGVF